MDTLVTKGKFPVNTLELEEMNKLNQNENGKVPLRWGPLAKSTTQKTPWYLLGTSPGKKGSFKGVKQLGYHPKGTTIFPMTYMSCMDTTYVRETPSPKQSYKAGYLHFWYLKLLVIVLMVQKSQTTTWDGAKTLYILGQTTNLNW